MIERIDKERDEQLVEGEEGCGKQRRWEFEHKEKGMDDGKKTDKGKCGVEGWRGCGKEIERVYTMKREWMKNK